jgi:hypothetical protein
MKDKIGGSISETPAKEVAASSLYGATIPHEIAIMKNNKNIIPIDLIGVENKFSIITPIPL